MIAKRIGYFRIEKGKQAGSGVYQFDLATQAAKYGRIFTTDDTGTDNGNLAWRMIQIQNAVAIENTGVSKINA